MPAPKTRSIFFRRSVAVGAGVVGTGAVSAGGIVLPDSCATCDDTGG
jgi:hypothetical protein